MRAVVQRIESARVTVEGEEISRVGEGLLVYLGVEREDGDVDLEYMARKVAGLRVFEDERGAMNLSVEDVGGEVLVVSQFTLLGDCRKGRRPSFVAAMEPGGASGFYERFVERLRERGIGVSGGVFRAFMKVESTNSGPVTLLVDSRKAL